MHRLIVAISLTLTFHALVFADATRIDSLSSLLNNSQDTIQVNILLDLATEYEYIDRAQALKYASKSMDLADSINYRKGLIRSYYELAIISFLDGDRSTALEYLEKGLAQAESSKNLLYLATGYFHMSHFYEEDGNYVIAIDYLHKALNIFQQNSEQLRISQCYSGFGGIYKALGQFEESLNYFFKALEIKEKLNDERGISIVSSNIGGVYLLTSKLDEAHEYFFKALAIDRKNGDTEGILYSLNRIGVGYQKKEAHQMALAYYDTALVMAREFNFRVDESILLGNVGSTFRSLGKYQESLDHLFQALDLKKELQRDASAAHTCNDICETYMSLESYPEARKYALEAIELAKHTDANQHRVALYLLSDCEYKLQNFQKAYDHLVQANVLTDSLFTIESEARMHEMEVKYQTEQKEQDIEKLIAINKVAKYRNISYAGAAISFLILGGLLYYVQRLRTRKNRILLDKEKDLDRMKSRFFANISHEFRTPLTLILGPVSEMIEKVNQLEIKRKLNTIQKNARRMLDLVNQLLDLSKIESGQLQLESREQDIISMIRGVTMSFHSAAEQKNIELQLDIECGELILSYDRRKIETVLINLLSNSMKFTPQGGKIVVKVKLIEKATPSGLKGFVQISVADSGVGIPQEDLEQIFNRFYQSDNNRLQQQEGSGIGLALAKEFVELHEGAISAASVDGEGTEILFEFPTDLEATISQTTSEDFISLKSEKVFEGMDDSDKIDASTEKELVLVIEDHEDVRNYINEVLKDNYRISMAKDGDEGIEEAMKLIPDLVVSDVMMPGKNGHEVCSVLKNDEKTSHIPLILLTSKSESKDKIAGLESMADDYLTKPFVPNELLARIKNLIAGRKKLQEKYIKEGILRPGEVAANSVDEQFLKKLVASVEQHMSNEQFGVEQLGDVLGMSRSQLHRKLTALIDESPNQFIRSFRLQRAHDLLQKQSATSSEIAYQVGFSSPSYFTKCFHAQFGYTPSEVLINQ